MQGVGVGNYPYDCLVHSRGLGLVFVSNSLSAISATSLTVSTCAGVLPEGARLRFCSGTRVGCGRCCLIRIQAPAERLFSTARVRTSGKLPSATSGKATPVPAPSPKSRSCWPAFPWRRQRRAIAPCHLQPILEGNIRLGKISFLSALLCLGVEACDFLAYSS